MSSWAAIASLIGAGVDSTLNAVFTGLNYKLTKDQNALQRDAFNFNKKMATDQWQWQKNQANLVMEREDNAIQRRKADLLASGMNPVLAVGSGGSASAPMASGQQVAGPQLSKFEKMSSMLALSNAVAQNENTRAQTALTKVETDLKKKDKDIKDAVLAKEIVNIDNAKKDGAYKDIQNSVSAWERDKSINTGISQNTSSFMKNIRDGSQMFYNLGRDLKQSAMNYWQKILNR